MPLKDLPLQVGTPLPPPNTILKEFPTSPTHQQFIRKSRQTIKNILDGNDPRCLLIMGPCSIHDPSAAKEYAGELKKLDDLSDLFFIVMRTYFEKPRTALGWKGMLYDPWLNGTHDIATGIRLTRKLLLELADMGIPTASEFLEPASAFYYGDLVSWGCIGARTSASQIHRQLASGLPMPTAFKNSVDGSVDNAINGILSASHPHTFMGINAEGLLSAIHTKGNSYGHLVLRGAEQHTNYDPQSISNALEKLRKAQLPSCLLIDCSHDNSLRQHEAQISVFQSVINQRAEGNYNIRGVLLESHLHAGNQHLHSDTLKLKYGVSVTDPCLNWEKTERLVLWGHSILKRERDRVLGNDLEDSCILMKRNREQ